MCAPPPCKGQQQTNTHGSRRCTCTYTPAAQPQRTPSVVLKPQAITPATELARGRRMRSVLQLVQRKNANSTMADIMSGGLGAGWRGSSSCPPSRLLPHNACLHGAIPSLHSQAQLHPPTPYLPHPTPGSPSTCAHPGPNRLPCVCFRFICPIQTAVCPPHPQGAATGCRSGPQLSAGPPGPVAAPICARQPLQRDAERACGARGAVLIEVDALLAAAGKRAGAGCGVEG